MPTFLANTVVSLANTYNTFKKKFYFFLASNI
jgi:hypothetical protein